jgi:hypothetical protein
LSRRERLQQAAQRRRELAEARRRAEAARLAAIARQRAIEQAMRDDVAASIARDDVTGEDMEVRRAAVAALGNRIGTVVVMSPKDGRIYSIVNQDWAVRRGFKPCSTIKLVTGLAGLSEKVISPFETVDVSTASYRLDLTDALAYSTPNSYFQRIGSSVGLEHMITYARDLGLGEPTGINHVNEYAGRVPVYKTGASNRIYSHGDDFEVTPIQLATLASAIANGGELLTPHLPRTPQEGFNFKKIVRRKVNISNEAFQRLVSGSDSLLHTRPSMTRNWRLPSSLADQTHANTFLRPSPERSIACSTTASIRPVRANLRRRLCRDRRLIRRPPPPSATRIKRRRRMSKMPSARRAMAAPEKAK